MKNLFLHPIPSPFFTLPLLRKCCWKFLHLFLLLPTHALVSLYLTYPRSSTLFLPPGTPCCSVHQAVCTSVCPALAIVKIWPKKKCVHGEEDKDRWLRKEVGKRQMQKTVQHQSLLLTHPLCSHPLSYLYTLIYIPSPFLKNYPYPISFITSPCLAQARILIDFICAHVSKTVAKTRVWGGENEKLEYIEEGKGRKSEDAARGTNQHVFFVLCLRH